MTIRSEDGMFKCTFADCGKKFTWANALKRYSYIHTDRNRNRIKCDRCSQAFIHNFHLMNHLRISHGVKPFKCKICGEHFKVISDLSKHKEINHKGWNDHKCDTCNKCFKYHSNLQIHIRSHTGEKPFKCERCDFSCSQKSSLNRHLRVVHDKQLNGGKLDNKMEETAEQNEKEEEAQNPNTNPYSCNECGEEFGIFRDLAKHKRAAQCKGEEIEDVWNNGEGSHELSSSFLEEKSPPMSLRNSEKKSQTIAMVETMKNINKVSIRNHIRIRKTIQCPKCEKKYRFAQELKLHKLTHSDNYDLDS